MINAMAHFFYRKVVSSRGFGLRCHWTVRRISGGSQKSIAIFHGEPQSGERHGRAAMGIGDRRRSMHWGGFSQATNPVERIPTAMVEWNVLPDAHRSNGWPLASTWDVMLVLLHELAHWLGPRGEGHSREFWLRAVSLYKQYGIPRKVLRREERYKKMAGKVLAEHW